MDRRGVIAVLLAAPVIGVLVALISLGNLPDPATGDVPATPIASPSSSASVAPTGSPAEETAASVRINETFDMLPTDIGVPDWTADDAVSVTVAVQPTAVQRSARFTAEEEGRACRSLPGRLTELTAYFMLDPLPAEAPTTLGVEMDDGSTWSVVVSSDGARLADSGDPAVVDAGKWYRLSVVSADDAWLLNLYAEDGTRLGAGRADRNDAPAVRFCVSLSPPSELYLDTFIVEAN